jgi:hypothetical protein
VKRCVLLQGSRWWGDVNRGMRRACMGEQHMSSAWVRSESGVSRCQVEGLICKAVEV